MQDVILPKSIHSKSNQTPMPPSQSFSLTDFPNAAPALCQVSGQIRRDGSVIHLHYELKGTHSVQIPGPTAPDRRYDLWEATCFEWFVGVPGAIDYWEFNMAPSGQWNCFYLADYRQGLREEEAIAVLPFGVREGDDRLTLELTVDLGGLIPANLPIEVAITTVVQAKTGELHYLALAHCGDEADFHLRESFQIRL
jgi:hypothetical protein